MRVRYLVITLHVVFSGSNCKWMERERDRRSTRFQKYISRRYRNSMSQLLRVSSTFLSHQTLGFRIQRCSSLNVFGMDIDEQCYIQNIVDDTHASGSGICVNDRIISINMQKVNSALDIKSKIDEMDYVVFTIIRKKT